MARKQEVVEITDDNRDKGKVFVVTEMSAADAEEWVTHLALALMASGAEVPDALVGSGLQALAVYGVRLLAGMKPEQAKPLLDKLADCIQIVPDPKRTPQFMRKPIADGDIEEWTTRIQLKLKAADLIVGFSAAGAASTSASVQAPHAA
jgi:hypothetical protein